MLVEDQTRLGGLRFRDAEREQDVAGGLAETAWDPQDLVHGPLNLLHL